MSRKSFWNWLGLPSFSDIQDLQASARRQEEALSSLGHINAEANKVLASIQGDLSASVEQVNRANQSMLEVVQKNVCGTIQAGIDGSRVLVSNQMSELMREALSTIKSELNASAEQINLADQGAIAAAEKTICDLVQIYAEKSEKNLTDHAQTLTDYALTTAKTELAAAMEQAHGEGQKTVDAAEQGICTAISTYTESSRQILSEQVDKIIEGIAALSAFCNTAYNLDKDTQERIEHITTECRAQSELLRILLANTLIDNVSQKISPKDGSTRRIK